jgi:amphi-Trp domain-containing protein
MGGEKQAFEMKDEMELEKLADYLDEVSKSIGSGRLTLHGEEDGIDVELPALVKFEIAAKSKPGKGKISIEVKWKEPEEESDGLEINGSAPSENGEAEAVVVGSGYQSSAKEDKPEADVSSKITKKKIEATQRTANGSRRKKS